jgi:hypothetical protein
MSVRLRDNGVELRNAVKYNDDEEVSRLVNKNKVNPDTTNSRGETALMICIDGSALLADGEEMTKCHNIAGILLRGGADPFKMDKFNNSAMSRASGHFDKSMSQIIYQFASTRNLGKRGMIHRAFAEAERYEDVLEGYGSRAGAERHRRERGLRR